MARGAAFFDLDRTLLRGASGPVIAEALKEAGITSRSLPAEQVVYRLYDLFGENRPTMEVTRRAVRFASGWSRERVQEAGRAAATGLALTIQPFPRTIFAPHRPPGRAPAPAPPPPYP